MLKTILVLTIELVNIWMVWNPIITLKKKKLGSGWTDKVNYFNQKNMLKFDVKTEW